MVVNQSTGTALITLPEAPGFERSSLRQSGIGTLLSQAAAKQSTGKAEPMSLLLEALQYYAVRLMSEMGGAGWAVSNVLGTARAQVAESAPSADLTDYSPGSLDSALSGNRFRQLPSEQFWWSMRKLRLPSGTSLELFWIPSSPTTGVEKRGVRLRKPAFFAVTIQLEPIGIGGGLPQGVTVSEAERSRAGTFFAKVSIHSEFERLTSGNRRTGQYKQWVSWLSEQLRGRLSD